MPAPVTAVLDAVAKRDRRILLTLATGTGKTSIAFQIAWKFQARWNLTWEPARRPRILFLADRNILADQAYNAFSAFPKDAIMQQPTPWGAVSGINRYHRHGDRGGRRPDSSKASQVNGQLALFYRCLPCVS